MLALNRYACHFGRAVLPLVASAVLLSWAATACGPVCPSTIRAGSSPADVGVSYPDTCSRSGDSAVDFDGQFWVPASPVPTGALNELHACSQASFGFSPQPAAPPATLKLLDQTQLQWSDGTSTFLLVSAGRTEATRCG
jgi:hypothetical protein